MVGKALINVPQSCSSGDVDNLLRISAQLVINKLIQLHETTKRNAKGVSILTLKK